MAYLMLLCFLFPIFFPPTFSQLQLHHLCSDENGNFTANSTYQRNLNTLLSSFPSTILQNFHNQSAGESPNRVNRILLCRGDITLESCRNCFNQAASALPKLCPNQKEAITWYDECMLRYSSRTINSTLERRGYVYIESPNITADTHQFNTTLRSLMIDLRNKAASARGLKFAIGKANFTVSKNLYGLAQCTPYISESDCSYCLNASIQAVSGCSEGIMVGRIFTPNCNVRYDTLQFYTTSEVPPPPPPAGSFPPPPSNKSTKGTNIGKLHQTFWRF